MAEYAKKKNDELIALCKERGLPHNGKKADLVKRLEDNDVKAIAEVPAAKPAIEDEIDWDDEPATETAKAATTEANANAIAAGGVGEVTNPVAVPNQELAVDPAKTDDLTVVSAPTADAPVPEAETAAAPTAEAETFAAPVEEKKEEKDYSSGVAERTIDEEIEKRKARARKFGLPEDSDEIKQLERAKRFGTTDLSSVPGLLNKALSSGPRERKRGREGDQDGGIRKKNGGRGRPGMGGRQGSDRPKENGRPKEVGSSGTWMTAADREAAEKRKQRFATTTSTSE